MDYDVTFPISNSAVTTAKETVQKIKLTEEYEVQAAFTALKLDVQWLADDAKELAVVALEENPDTFKMSYLAREIIRRVNRMEKK